MDLVRDLDEFDWRATIRMGRKVTILPFRAPSVARTVSFSNDEVRAEFWGSHILSRAEKRAVGGR